MYARLEINTFYCLIRDILRKSGILVLLFFYSKLLYAGEEYSDKQLGATAMNYAKQLYPYDCIFKYQHSEKRQRKSSHTINIVRMLQNY